MDHEPRKLTVEIKFQKKTIFQLATREQTLASILDHFVELCGGSEKVDLRQYRVSLSRYSRDLDAVLPNEGSNPDSWIQKGYTVDDLVTRSGEVSAQILRSNEGPNVSKAATAGVWHEEDVKVLYLLRKITATGSDTSTTEGETKQPPLQLEDADFEEPTRPALGADGQAAELPAALAEYVRSFMPFPTAS